MLREAVGVQSSAGCLPVLSGIKFAPRDEVVVVQSSGIPVGVIKEFVRRRHLDLTYFQYQNYSRRCRVESNFIV